MSQPAIRPHVLLIDDDESIRRFITEALTDEGYEVSATGQGETGLKLLDSHQFDLVLLDMRMPFMDGRNFLRAYAIRPPPRPRIVALTASRESLDDTWPYRVDGFLAKPFELDDMLNLVAQLTGR